MIYIGGNNYGIATEGNLSIENLKFEFGEGAKAAQGVHTTRDVSNIQEAEVLPNTPEEAVKMALEWLIEERDEKGAYLFTAQNQWAGIYRVMLDKELCEQNVSAFCRYIASLNLNYHDGLNTPAPKSHVFDNLPSSYDKWEPKIGDVTDEKKHKVATKFKSKLTELLPK